MANSVNRVTILGNLGKDPDIRSLKSGGKIVNLTVATSESWHDKASGERKELTEWHRVVIMNDALADVAEKYLRKGSKLYLEGKLQTRKWTDQSGVDRYTTEIMLGRFDGKLVMLGERKDAAQGGYQGARTEAGSGFKNEFGTPGAPRAGADLDDEIPF